MSASTTCDVCGATTTEAGGWLRLATRAVGTKGIPGADDDVCSPDCLRVWAQRRAEAWAADLVMARQVPAPTVEGIAARARAARAAGFPRPDGSHRMTVPHQERLVLNPSAPLRVDCPECAALAGHACRRTTADGD